MLKQCIRCIVFLVCLFSTSLLYSDNPYLYDFAIDSSETYIDFDLKIYGDANGTGNLIGSDGGRVENTSGNVGVALWCAPADMTSLSNLRMNTMDVSTSETIDISIGSQLAGVEGTVSNLRLTDTGNPDHHPESPIASDGYWAITDEQGGLDINAYGNVDATAYMTFIPIMSEQIDISDYNPQNSSISGFVTPMGNTLLLHTDQAAQDVINFQEYESSAPDWSGTYDIFAHVEGTSPVTSGALQLFAEAGTGSNVWSGQSMTLDASGSYDPQSDAITSYLWDLDGDGLYDDASGATPTVSGDDLLALGLGYGTNAASLWIEAEDGYWATDDVVFDLLPSLPGDADIDGDVDSDDLATWGANYTGEGGIGRDWFNADFDLDGDVDSDDLATWGANYTGSGSALKLMEVAYGNTVPEPATITFLGLGLAANALRRRARRTA